MTNEMVKHHNDFNTVIMRMWNAEEMNFFFEILSKARDKGTAQLHFDTNELKELVNYSKKHNHRWEETMKSCTRKVAQLTYVEETENVFRVMTMFNKNGKAIIIVVLQTARATPSFDTAYQNSPCRF